MRRKSCRRARITARLNFRYEPNHLHALRWIEDAVTRFLGSLTFGGMFGGGLAGLLHTLWLTGSTTAFEPLVFSGILFGSALHKPISIAWDHFLGPVARLGSSLIELRKLKYYADRDMITSEKFRELIGKVIEDDILASSESKRLLPPDSDS